jgi:3-hydroxyanthranilate 3,4-dioxygenase
MATGRLHAFNFQHWIKEHQHLLKPPVGNKKVFEDGEMTVQVVGGPNERTDYHDDPVEEFFYQLKGDMVLKVADNGNFYDVPIREGDVFLLRRMYPIRRSDRRKARSGWWWRRRGPTRSMPSNGTASSAARSSTALRSKCSTW